MKVDVSREKLGEAVAFVSRALPSRPVIPVLSGMLLDAGDDGLTISCFDYEVSARIRLDADVAEPGTALVPGRLLAEITRSLPARPVRFSAEGDMVNLTAGAAEFGLVCLPAADYPALPAAPAPVGEVGGAALAAAVAQVAPAASRDDTLPMLTAICLDISGGTLTAAATDRYRLATRQLEFAPARPGVRTVALVPARVMSETARAMAQGKAVTVAFEPGGEGGGRGDVHPAEGLISFAAGDRQVTARLIGGEFIRYESRFPAEFGYRAMLPAGPVIDAVRRSALVAERAGPVRLSFGSGEVMIQAHAEGRARAAERLPARFDSPDRPEIAFNPHYLLDGLAAAAASEAERGTVGERGTVAERAGMEEPGGDDAGAGSGWIQLDFTSPAKPALITWGGRDEEPASAGTFRYLLVPLRAPGR